ncbi:unnamed protein product, partial [Staurois parvus]
CANWSYLFLGPELSSPSSLPGASIFSVRSLWSSPVLCLQSLVISCTVSAVSGHLLYCVCSLWSSPVLSAISGHLLYCIHSLWSSPVVCLQSLVISCTMSAVHWFRIFFFLFSSSKT